MNEKLEVNISYLFENNYYTNTRQVRELLLGLKAKGIDTLTVDDTTLMNDDEFLKVLDYIKYAGLKIELKTNGEDLEKYDDVLNKFNTVRLEMDAISDHVLEELYGDVSQYQANLENYVYLRKNHPDVAVQIDTYFNQLNFKEIASLYEVISGMDIEQWNIVTENKNIERDDILLGKPVIDTIVEFLDHSDFSDKIHIVKKENAKVEMKKHRINMKTSYLLLKTIY